MQRDQWTSKSHQKHPNEPTTKPETHPDTAKHPRPPEKVRHSAENHALTGGEACRKRPAFQRNPREAKAWSRRISVRSACAPRVRRDSTIYRSVPSSARSARSRSSLRLSTSSAARVSRMLSLLCPCLLSLLLWLWCSWL